jgi:hypothetical protein
MFTRNTVLVLKEPKSTKDAPFPYDRVRVLGPSPVHRPSATGEWEGADAQGVIIQPVDEFAGNLDEPYGRLKRLYKIESEPEPVDQNIRVEVIPAHTRQAGLTPEEAFAQANEEAGIKPGQKRSAVADYMHAMDPLDSLDVNDPARAPQSPLDTVDSERARVTTRAAKGS